MNSGKLYCLGSCFLKIDKYLFEMKTGNGQKECLIVSGHTMEVNGDLHCLTEERNLLHTGMEQLEVQ